MQQPKFQKHLQDTIKQAQAEKAIARPGIVISYDRYKNTATVLMTAHDSDAMGDILRNVPCPVTMGVQTVAPEPGRPCWVSFKGDRDTTPIVISFFNHNFQEFDYTKHYSAKNAVPQFMIGM